MRNDLYKRALKIWKSNHPAKVARPQADEVNMLWGLYVLMALRGDESKKELLATLDADPSRTRKS